MYLGVWLSLPSEQVQAQAEQLEATDNHRKSGEHEVGNGTGRPARTLQPPNAYPQSR